MRTVLITPTGGRQASFNFCQEMMKEQDYKGGVHWIIVDDCEEPQDIWFERDNWTLEIIRPEPFWQKGENTQKRNVREGAKKIEESDKVIIIEDDDWYNPSWISKVVELLDEYEAVGGCRNYYYNIISHRYRKFSNKKHAALCATAFRGTLKDKMLSATNEDSKCAIDHSFWRGLDRNNTKLFPIQEGEVLGIKGLPGRQGIGDEHETMRSFSSMRYVDAKGDMLENWMGKEWATKYRKTLLSRIEPTWDYVILSTGGRDKRAMRMKIWDMATFAWSRDFKTTKSKISQKSNIRLEQWDSGKIEKLLNENLKFRPHMITEEEPRLDVGASILVDYGDGNLALIDGRRRANKRVRQGESQAMIIVEAHK